MSKFKFQMKSKAQMMKLKEGKGFGMSHFDLHLIRFSGDLTF